jgi:hypothetical protein
MINEILLSHCSASFLRCFVLCAFKHVYERFHDVHNCPRRSINYGVILPLAYPLSKSET